MDVDNSCSLTFEEEINIFSTPTSNRWFYVLVNSSNFEGVSLASKYNKSWMDWILDVISKECMLRPPIHVGELCITNGKVRMILNIGSRALWSGAKIEQLCRIVRTRDANISDGSQCVSWPMKTSCGKRLVLFKRKM